MIYKTGMIINDYYFNEYHYLSSGIPIDDA